MPNDGGETITPDNLETLTHLRVGTGWIELEVLTEPFVTFRARKYSPVIQIKVLQSGLEYLFLCPRSPWVAN